MKSGPDLDMLVATKIMGHKHNEVPKIPGMAFRPTKTNPTEHVPMYSVDINLAWKVLIMLQRLADENDMPEIQVKTEYDGANIIGPQWSCQIKNEITHAYEIEETAPLAICLAALSFLGVAIPKVQASS